MPGILVAATGVGAGDLLTASLAGSSVGLAVLWAVVVGAVLKWFLTEGIARWQMVTGTTLLEGWGNCLGGWIQWVFLVYLLIWTVFTGGALVSACGVAGTGLFSISDDPMVSKIAWGVIHSFVGLLFVWRGGFKLFSLLMSISIGVMFVTVMVTAVLIDPDWSAVGRGLVVPSIPDDGAGWVLGILGGVGGTVTLLSYGYWIRETDRSGGDGLRLCRIDLAMGYTLTALFGIAMVIIGSRVQITRGPMLALDLATQLESVLGAGGKWVFLAGFWGAVFSSLMGVWQSVPYLFADFLLTRNPSDAVTSRDIDLTKTNAYRAYLVGLAIVSLPLLWVSVKQAQLAYAVMGSFFMPLLALTLLLMNNRSDWTGRSNRNGWITNIVLCVTLAFFAYVGVKKAFESVSEMLSTQEVATAAN